jgi:hypothetical protein
MGRWIDRYTRNEQERAALELQVAILSISICHQLVWLPFDPFPPSSLSSSMYILDAYNATEVLLSRSLAIQK